MNWEAVGAISQIVGAVLVGITLIYLAVQLRQNTSALKSSTFLAISTLMGSTMEVWATHSDLAPLLIKAQAGLDELSPDERARFGFLMMMAFRRVETVVVQRHLGFIDRTLTEGFERSALSALHAKGVRQWWDASKDAFSNLFSAWVDEKLASNLPRPIHAGLGLGGSKNEVENGAAQPVAPISSDYKTRFLLLPNAAKEAPLLLPAFPLWSQYRARMQIDCQGRQS
jgi:hypothetical protein